MNQRRRPSPAVYRRRQLVAAPLAVLLLVLVIWGIQGVAGLFSQDEDAPQEQATGAPADPDDEPSAVPETVDDPEPEEVPEGQCAPADIGVVASTDKSAYLSDEAPLLSMEITNNGSEACALEVGTAQQAFRISRDGREIFTTTQCELRGSSLELEFEPGQSERAQMVWPRSDSAVDCSQPAELAGGEYQLRVSVSGISSELHTFDMAGETL